MASALEIANQALLRVGAAPITSGEFTTPTLERAVAVSNSWPFVRREVLRSHPWGCATTRVKLLQESAYTSSGALVPAYDMTQAFRLPANCLRILEVDTDLQWRVEVAPVALGAGKTYLSTYPSVIAERVTVVTTGAHGLTDGDLVFLTAANQADLVNVITPVTVGSTTLVTLDEIDPTDFVDGCSAGGGLIPVTNEPCILTECDGPLGVLYVIDIEDPSAFDAMLTEALVLRLAAEIVERVTDSTSKRELLMVEYQNFMREVRYIEGQEQSPVEFEEDSWITSRY
jgi:hypothetical protein